MEFALDVIVSAFSLFVVACYTWSLHGHFASQTMPVGAKVISAVVVATTALLLYLIWSTEQRAAAQLVGLGVEILAAALFWWAIAASRKARLRFAFDPENPHSIVRTGPYRYLRHPFYTSYLLFWSGWALAASSGWAIAPVLLFVVIYVTAAKKEERNFSATSMSREYELYRQQTGFLWPRISQRK